MGGPGGGTGAAGEGAQPIDGNRSSQSAVGSESSAADRLAVAAGSGGQGPAPGARTTPTGTTAALSLRAETGAYRRKPVIVVRGSLLEGHPRSREEGACARAHLPSLWPRQSLPKRA